jgi:small-conductance mechanosensitive channel
VSVETASWGSVLRESLSGAWEVAARYLPNVLGAAALLLAGWLLGRLLRAWVARLVARLDGVIPKRLFERDVGERGVDRLASELVGRLVFWIVFLFFVAAAAEALQLPVATSGLARFSGYLPHVVAAAVILFAGLVGGNLARSAVVSAAATAGLGYGETLGQATKLMVLLVAGIVAVDQLGVQSTLLIATLSILLGAVIGAVGLAFGLGARTAVANIIAAHHVVQLYRVGQHVRIGDVQGEIVEFRSIGVLIDSPEGRVFVPAKSFAESASVGLAQVR